MPNSSRRRSYSKIQLQKRQQLVNLVINKHLSIAKAGRRLKVKPSTAKLIIKKYRETGQFFGKREESRNLRQSDSNQVQRVIQEQNNAPEVNQANNYIAQQNTTYLGYIYYLGAQQVSQRYFYPTTYENNFMLYYC